MNAPAKSPKSVQYYMRAIHRILGYLAFGMVVVYALSGITLIHRTGDFMKKSTHVETTLEPGMEAMQLGEALKIKNFKATEESASTIYFADGQYDKVSGNVSYIKKEVVSPLNRCIDLHKLPDAKNPHIALATTIFGIVLFFLAVTSLFMYKTNAKQFKYNMIYTALGIIFAILLVIAV